MIHPPLCAMMFLSLLSPSLSLLNLAHWVFHIYNYHMEYKFLGDELKGRKLNTPNRAQWALIRPQKLERQGFGSLSLLVYYS